MKTKTHKITPQAGKEIKNTVVTVDDGMEWMFFSVYTQRGSVQISFPGYSTPAAHATLHAAAPLLSAEEIAHPFILLPLTSKEVRQKTNTQTPQSSPPSPHLHA